MRLPTHEVEQLVARGRPRPWRSRTGDADPRVWFWIATAGTARTLSNTSLWAGNLPSTDSSVMVLARRPSAFVLVMPHRLRPWGQC